eukprot:COSAG01_NODE_5923_length_3949_cov_100.549091_3_plen_126_part_00
MSPPAPSPLQRCCTAAAAVFLVKRPDIAAQLVSNNNSNTFDGMNWLWPLALQRLSTEHSSGQHLLLLQRPTNFFIQSRNFRVGRVGAYILNFSFGRESTPCTTTGATAKFAHVTNRHKISYKLTV